MKVINLTVGPLQTNCYILYGKNGNAAVIDPGFYPDRIKEVLEEKGLKLEKILLTHAHFDHITAAEELRGEGAELYLHRADEEMLKDSRLSCMMDFLGYEIKFKNAERLLEDGDTFELDGEEIKTVHTPGHTKGSVCYVTGNYIFSGDTLFRESIGRTDLYGGNFDTLKESLKKLAELEGDYTVLPGHGEHTTLTYEKNNNIYMKTLR